MPLYAIKRRSATAGFRPTSRRTENPMRVTLHWMAVTLAVTIAPCAHAQSSVLPPLTGPPPAIAAPRLGGYVQARETLERRVGATGTLNRVRLTAEGSLPNRFSYR